MLTEGSKAIYCLGEKEEVVDIIKIHPDSITIFIPSIQRERDTLPEKLKPIIEEKKIILELPEKEPLSIFDGKLSLREMATCISKIPITKLIRLSVIYPDEHLDNHAIDSSKWFNENYVDIKKDSLYKLTNISSQQQVNDIVISYISELYKEVVNLENRDKVLLENEKQLMEQVNSLQETVKALKKRDEERETELWTLLKIHNEQKMVYELELKELRKIITKKD